MTTINHETSGGFNWRCLLGHSWGAWSKIMCRSYPAPSLDEFLWKQRKCARCGKLQGVEIPCIE